MYDSNSSLSGLLHPVFTKIEYFKALFKIAKQKAKATLETPHLDDSQLTIDIVQQIKQDGFMVFQNLYTNGICDRLKNEVDQLHVSYSDQLWKDRYLADKRLFGANQVSDLIDAFYSNEFINSIRDCYYQSKNITGFTMASRIDAVENNVGSGGGWHRDSIFEPQLKAISHLTDVSINNGPFQYLAQPHSHPSKLAVIKKANLLANQNRLNQSIVDQLQMESEYKLTTFTAKKGTLIIVDTTGIHRGSPIVEDSRYALTNYWFLNKIPTHIKALTVDKKSFPINLTRND